MSKRIKAPSFATREEFLAAVSRVAQLETEKRIIEARRDRAIQRISLRYDAVLEPITSEMKTLAAIAEKYAVEHRGELLPDDKVKSVKAALARYGWKIGNPKTDALSRWTVEKIVAALEENGLGAYVRTKKEIDRDKILADGKAGTLTNAKGDKVSLSTVGIKIAQGETFYIEPDSDAADTVKAPEAIAS